MKQKIELSFEAFMRWLYSDWSRDGSTRTDHTAWQSLCAEAEKKEPIETWFVVSSDLKMKYHFWSKESAESFIGDQTDYYKIVKLREVAGEL
jgi:hypothetical protein